MRQLLRTLMLALVRILGFPGARMAAAQAVHRSIPTAPRILLIRPDHLGDLVLTTPILHALKSQIPNAQITMMVGPWSSEVVARHRDVDRILLCPFPGFQRAAQKPLAPYILLFSVAQQLRRGNYDLAINLRPDFWWGAALLYLARVPSRIGYAIKPGTPFLTHAIPFQSPRAPEPATISSLRLASVALEALGQAPLEQPCTPERYPLEFIPTAEEAQWVTERLSKAGIGATEPFVVIHPGTGAAVKLWRNEAWSHCANSLPALLTYFKPVRPVRIILTGSHSEQPMLQEIAAGIASPPLLITDATVGQLAALLKLAQIVIGVDSGPLHLAVAQGTPTLHLFGPTDPRIFGPWGEPRRHVVLASTHLCPTCTSIPCGRLDFRADELAAHPCVRLIREQQVETAIAAIFKTQTVERQGASNEQC